VTSKEKADDIAKEIEVWLDPNLYRRVNEVFAGLRQLWESKEDPSKKENNRAIIRRNASKYEMLDDVELVCRK